MERVRERRKVWSEHGACLAQLSSEISNRSEHAFFALLEGWSTVEPQRSGASAASCEMAPLALSEAGAAANQRRAN